MIPGVNVLLMGAPGTGKTHAIRTLIDAGLEVFVLFTEPGMEVLADTPSDKLHWHYVAPAQPSFDVLTKNAKMVNQFDAATLQKQTNMNKADYQQYLEVLSQCNNFQCQRCGKEFGCIDAWDTSRAFVFDSLSGLNIMLLDLVVGGKPLRTQPDWGIAMDNEERFLNKLTLGTRCHFILTAHVDRQVDEVLGGIKLMVNALGKKLPPLVPRFFSDVILTVREADEFSWSTATANADTKARNLPWKTKQTPSFVPIINNWRPKQ